MISLQQALIPRLTSNNGILIVNLPSVVSLNSARLLSSMKNITKEVAYLFLQISTKYNY